MLGAASATGEPARRRVSAGDLQGRSATMHELALMQSLVQTVEDEVRRGRVHSLAVEIGELAAVAPDALRFCFALCAQDTRLEGARLEVIAVEGSDIRLKHVEISTQEGD